MFRFVAFENGVRMAVLPEDGFAATGGLAKENVAAVHVAVHVGHIFSSDVP